MDALNKKILMELMKNSRIAITQLAKKVRASREVVNYRIKNMMKEGIILKFVTEINIKMLGYSSSAAFINVKAEKEKEFKEFIKKCDFTSWGGSFAGVWRYGIDIYGKDAEDIDDNFNQIYRNFKESILSHRLSLYKQTYFMHEKYLGVNVLINKIRKIITQKIDSKDKKILEELSNNSRIDTVKLASIVSLSTPAVAKRIHKLESSGYIIKYSIFIDITKLGLYQYSVFITNNNILDRDRLIKYLKARINVPFIVEYIGDPFVEFGIVTKNPYDLRPILQEIEESFPDNRLEDVFLIQNEFLSIGPPKCIFK